MGIVLGNIRAEILVALPGVIYFGKAFIVKDSGFGIHKIHFIGIGSHLRIVRVGTGKMKC